MVRAGEIGGMLDAVLLRSVNQLEKGQELSQKLNNAMSYPTIVLVLAVLASSFMLIFIVPIFAGMFEDYGGTLPLPTRAALSFSGVLTSLFEILTYAALAPVCSCSCGGERPKTEARWWTHRCARYRSTLGT
jgi:type IV pilus assembly protein PilC